jgi:sugar lactone lactonase YvrE
MRKNQFGLFHTILWLGIIAALAVAPSHAQVALQSGTINFGVVTVGESISTTLTFGFTQDVQLSGAPDVVTQGSIQLDFTNIQADGSTAGTCLEGQWLSGSTCTVQVTFTPQYPGLRMGAVMFVDTGGNIISTTYIQGVGSGSMPVLTPGVSETAYSFTPDAVTVDAAGNVYVGGTQASGYVGLWTGNASSMIAGGFDSDDAAAIDGAGNIYVADPSGGYVWKITPSIPWGANLWTARTTTSWASSSASEPVSLAVDGSGDLFIGDQNSESVVELAPDGTVTTVASDFVFIAAIALDGAGSLYVADLGEQCSAYPGYGSVCEGTNLVWKIPGAGQQIEVWQGEAIDMAVDGGGNLYIVDLANKLLWKVPQGPWPYSNPQKAMLVDTANYGLTGWRPMDIAIDGLGDAYITDVVNQAMYELAGANYFVITINGVCGAANGQAIGSGPTQPSDLCSAGAPSAVAGSGPWTWSCAGLYGGTTASCSANPNTTYTVTFNVNSAMAGSLAGATTQTVSWGGSTSAVTANAASGYYFDGWTQNGVLYSTANPLTITNVTASTTLTASFAVGTCGAAGTIVQSSGSFLPPTPTDSEGNTYAVETVVVNDRAMHSVMEEAPNGASTTIMAPTYATYGGLALDAANNLYVGYIDYNISPPTGSILKRNPNTGQVTTVATGLKYPCFLAVDPNGTYIYMTDCGDTNVVKVNAATGQAATITLNVPPAPPYYQPYTAEAMQVDSYGDVYVDEIVDYSAADQTVEIMSGDCATPTPVYASCGAANGLAYSSAPSAPTDLCSSGVPSAVVGSGPWAWSCAGLVGGTPAYFCSTAGGTPNYIVDFTVNNPAGGTLTGTNPQMLPSGANATPVMANANSGYIFLYWIDSNGNVWNANPVTVTNVTGNLGMTAFFAPGSAGCPATGTVTTIAGMGYEFNPNATGIGDGGPALTAFFDFPTDVAMDGMGNLYIGDAGEYAIREVNASTGIINTVAGGNSDVASGDGGPATEASLGDFSLGGLAVDVNGNFYIGDSRDKVVRRVDGKTNIITTIAGGGSGCSEYPCSATNAVLYYPDGLALDSAGTLYIGDGASKGSYIYEVNPATDMITNVVSFPSVEIYGETADTQGNIFVWTTAEFTGIMSVSKLTPNGSLTLVAGCTTGSCQTPQDGIPATSAQFIDSLMGVAVDGAGNLYLSVATDDGATIYKADANTGILSTFAGNGTYGYTGDYGPATAASFELGIGQGLMVDSSGDLIVADGDNSVIREVWSGICQSQTITFPNPGTQTYGVVPFVLTATASSGLPITYSVTSGPASVSGNVLTITGAGSVTVQAAVAASGSMPATTASVTFTVNPAALTITADNATKTYGQTLAFAGTEFVAGGLVNSDTVTSVTLTSAGTAADALVASSPYAITASAAQGTGLDNYTFSYEPGVLTVQPATPVVTVSCSEVPYDGAPHFCTCAAIGVFGEVVSGSCTVAPSETDAGSYPVAGTFTSGDPDYTNAAATGTLVIDKVNQNPTISCPSLLYDGYPHGCTVTPQAADITCASGTLTNVPGGTVSLSCTGDNNYLPWTGTGWITILPLACPLSPSWSCPVVTYDGLLHSCILPPPGPCNCYGPVPETNAGSYSVTLVCIAPNQNYLESTASGTLVINQAAQNPTVVCPSPITYDGKPHGCTVTPQAADITCVSGTVTNVPGGSVALSCTADNNYSPWTGTGSITISPAAGWSLTISPASLSLSFAAQAVGTSSVAQYIALTNTGTSPVPVGPATVSGPFAISNQAGTCTSSMNLAAGRTCVIRVVFSPTAGGTAAGSVVISSPDAPGGAFTVALSGTGQAPTAVATFSAPSVTFATPQLVGTSSVAQYLQIASIGSAPLQVTGVTLGGANPGDFAISNQAGTCTSGATLAYNAKCNLRIVFTPTATGTRTATLSVADNAAGSPQQIVLSGTGISPAQLWQSTTSLTFKPAPVGSETVAQYITLKNTGTVPVIVSSAVVSGADPGDFLLSNQAGTCTTGMTMNPGTGCNLRVNFTPKATGTRMATVVITDNAGGHSATLTGTGE